MYIERIALTNFRCFGPTETKIALQSDLTAFIGANGAGKTAVLQALSRLFGVTDDMRRVRRQDFHIPAVEDQPPASRELVIEVILSFPELDKGGALEAVPEFFHQMAATEDGRLKCRLRLQATLSEDGTLEGAIEQKFWAVRAFGAFKEDQCSELKASDRARIQMIYVPANRDGRSQVAEFLKGRLWRAINWSKPVKDTLVATGKAMNEAFDGEVAIKHIPAAVTKRWQQMHAAGTYTKPLFRPVDVRWQEFVRHIEVMFHPDEDGRERGLDDLSDSQRSIFHLAMTAAVIDIERLAAEDAVKSGFLAGTVSQPALTLVAIEEPENTLAPFYLSRIVDQVLELTATGRAQALLSSHSASIMARVEPEAVRHFRLDRASRTAKVRAIELPSGVEEEAKFVREAVRRYPELYFAGFVVLGEGASSCRVWPRPWVSRSTARSSPSSRSAGGTSITCGAFSLRSKFLMQRCSTSTGGGVVAMVAPEKVLQIREKVRQR
jgi:hypothetical protein